MIQRSKSRRIKSAIKPPRLGLRRRLFNAEPLFKRAGFSHPCDLRYAACTAPPKHAAQPGQAHKDAMTSTSPVNAVSKPRARGITSTTLRRLNEPAIASFDVYEDDRRA